jgi:hypothetical protein
MAVYPNHRYVFGSPARFTGGAAPGYEFVHQGGTARRNRFVNPHWSTAAGGSRTLLPRLPGALAAFDVQTAKLRVSKPALQAGRRMEAFPRSVSLSATGTLDLQARLSAGALMRVNVPVGLLARLESVNGYGQATVQSSGVLEARGSLQGGSQVTCSTQGILRGTGSLRAVLVPYPELSVESFVARVAETFGPRLDSLDTKLTNAVALAALG